MENSSINDLIHRQAKLAYNLGAENERQRILAIVKSMPKQFNHNDYVVRAVAKIAAELNAKND